MDQSQTGGRGDDIQIRRESPSGGGGFDPAGAVEGLAPLFSGLVKDLQDLLRGEIQLARAELKQDAAVVGRALAGLAAAALLGLTGFIFLMLAVTYLLSRFLRDWIAAGIVALALLAIAGILGMAGKRQLSAANLKPEQTIETLKEDKEWASRQINSVKR